MATLKQSLKQSLRQDLKDGIAQTIAHKDGSLAPLTGAELSSVLRLSHRCNIRADMRKICVFCVFCEK